jgi:hypothetical protein
VANSLNSANKATYSKPKLQIYGKVADLTAAGSAGNTEADKGKGDKKERA